MKRYSLLLSLLLLAGCASPAPVAPSASSSPAVAASSAPSANPTPVNSAMPQASSSSGLRLSDGVALKPYTFEWISGVYRDTARDQLLVSDAINNKVAPYRFMLRKFNADGSFLANAKLMPDGAQDPTGVDGIAFDLRGIPYYAYRQGEQYRLLKLVTAAVVPVDETEFPVVDIKRAGTSAITSIGRELLVGVVNLTSDQELTEEQKRDKTGGKLVYARAEEGEQPSALFQIPDPLYPTARMAFASNGDLYLAGPTREGKQTLMRLQGDQKLTTVQVDLGALPDAMWVSPQGNLLFAYDGVNGPAKLRLVSPEGKTLGETALKYSGGGYMGTPRGLTFDAKGAMVVGGRGFDGQGRTIDGLFRFEVLP